MRFIIILLAILIVNSAIAQEQFTQKIYAGANYTNLNVKSTNLNGYKYTSNVGWQAGVGTEFQPALFNYFLYIDVGVKHLSYDRDTTHSADTVYSYALRPLFLEIPFGIGFKFPLKNQKYIFKVYGGMDVLIGLGGKLKTLQLYYNNPNIDPNSSSDLNKKVIAETSLNYGDRNRSTYIFNYATSNWSFQLGAGLDIKRTGELAVVYNIGLTNILPGGSITDEIQKIQVVELTLKLDFPNDILSKRSAKK